MVPQDVVILMLTEKFHRMAPIYPSPAIPGRERLDHTVAKAPIATDQEIDLIAFYSVKNPYRMYTHPTVSGKCHAAHRGDRAFHVKRDIAWQ